MLKAALTLSIITIVQCFPHSVHVCVCLCCLDVAQTVNVTSCVNSETSNTKSSATTRGKKIVNKEMRCEEYVRRLTRRVV